MISLSGAELADKCAASSTIMVINLKSPDGSKTSKSQSVISLLEPLQQRGIEQVRLRYSGLGVGQLRAGERREEREWLQLIDGIGALHVRGQIFNGVRVVEPAGYAGTVCQSELRTNIIKINTPLRKNMYIDAGHNLVTSHIYHRRGTHKVILNYSIKSLSCISNGTMLPKVKISATTCDVTSCRLSQCEYIKTWATPLTL